METAVDLAALDALWQAATPGEWTVTADEPKRVYCVDGRARFWPVLDASPEDAALIAALHNAWPELRRRLEIGDAAVESLRDIQAECDRCLIVQGVPQAETPTTHGYGKIRDIAARARLRALREAQNG